MLYSKNQPHQPFVAQPLTGLTHVLYAFDGVERYFVLECRIEGATIKGWRQIITLTEPEYSAKIPFISSDATDFNYVIHTLSDIRHGRKNSVSVVDGHLNILRTISRNCNLVFTTATQK